MLKRICLNAKNNLVMFVMEGPIQKLHKNKSYHNYNCTFVEQLVIGVKSFEKSSTVSGDQDRWSIK